MLCSACRSPACCSASSTLPAGSGVSNAAETQALPSCGSAEDIIVLESGTAFFVLTGKGTPNPSSLLRLSVP